MLFAVHAVVAAAITKNIDCVRVSLRALQIVILVRNLAAITRVNWRDPRSETGWHCFTFMT